jgi:hypothetical protein
MGAADIAFDIDSGRRPRRAFPAALHPPPARGRYCDRRSNARLQAALHVS